jgi:hypothetical protein
MEWLLFFMQVESSTMFPTSSFGNSNMFGSTTPATTNYNPMKDIEVPSAPDDSVSALSFSPATLPATYLAAASWDNNVSVCKPSLLVMWWIHKVTPLTIDLSDLLAVLIGISLVWLILFGTILSLNFLQSSIFLYFPVIFSKLHSYQPSSQLFVISLVVPHEVT